ncbi:hypothetical protein L596_021798 [Steinernema carpocapsae]|uniref:7TM GPCR serpentine receptor class x (Srx) domain-containing protein n=1 Tax=Steinernema carpocapsae TaxID=34508 RepID=A0A4U5MJV7_STECR|nr:hypothetical protein L596_021798 [Steinernema carpocapsae]
MIDIYALIIGIIYTSTATVLIILNSMLLKTPGAAVMAVFEMYFDPICLASILLVYTMVVGFLVKAKKSSSNSTNLRKEVQMLFAAIFSFFYELFFIFWTFWVPKMIPHHGLLVKVSDNMFWLLDCGLFATVMLIFNKGLREKVFGCNKKNKNPTVTVPSTLNHR